MKRPGLHALPGLLVAAALLACVALVAGVRLRASYTSIAVAVDPFVLLQPDSVREEVIPDYAGVRRTYAFTLPDNSPMRRGLPLFVYLRHTDAVVELDGETRYDNTEWAKPHIDHTPGAYWLTVPMRAEYAGRTLTVTLTPHYASVRGEEPTFLLISRDSLLHKLVLPQDGALLALSAAAVLLGLFLLLLLLFLPMERRDRKRLLYLGAVTLCAGVWKLCGLPAVSLMLDYTGMQRVLWFCGAAGYLAMMLLSLGLLGAIRGADDNRTGTVCVCVASGVALGLVALQFANAVELHEVLIWYGIGMAVLHLVALLGKPPSRSELLWLLPFFLALGIDLAVYFSTGSMRAAPAFLIWIVLNLFVRGFGFVRVALLRERLMAVRESELREARIQTMTNQISPHFIYNTLLSVYEYCKDDPQRAMQVILDFTTYLQANFTAIATTELISFSEELKHTQAYVAVETVMFGDALQVEYDTAFTVFRLPPLTLQPIVENAIKYGVGQGHRPEHITVATRAADGGAEIIVEDDGTGYAPQTDSEIHVGLRNVRERLAMMCGGTLEIAPRPGGGTVVTVFVPMKKPDGEEGTRSTLSSLR